MERELPEEFLRRITALEASYLESDDPIRQSGFGGGAARWRQEREPILDGVCGDGELLDVGCANGFLLESLVGWGRERGLTLTPYGVDIGSRLVERARERLPQFREHFFTANAWDWQPPRRFRWVYALHDCVPPDYLAEYVRRLLARAVAPDGRLIVGAYGSRSRQLAPPDVAALLRSAGFTVSGSSEGGSPTIARFAWIDGNNDV